jgi:replicative DNA helicase
LSYSYKEDEKLPTLLEFAEKSLFQVTQTFIKNKLVHIKDVLSQRVEEICEFYENPETIDKHILNL